MARKNATIKIDAEGRDQGKLFYLTEMSCFQAERWAIRALLALAKSGVEIPDDIASAGMAGVASLGMRAFAGLNFDDAEPLLEEMLQCIEVIPDPANPSFHRSIVENDIEEVATILKLRSDVFRLHTDFSSPGVNSESTPKATGVPRNMRNIPTRQGR